MFSADCSHTRLVADCSTLTAQRNRSSPAVGLMSARVLAGCNQSIQIVAVDDLGRCPLGHRALVNDAVEALPISDSSLKNNSLSPSQWRTGVTWSRRRAPNTRRAAVFCSDCRRFISTSAVPVYMAFSEQLVNEQDFYYDSLYVNTHMSDMTCWA